MATDNFDRGTLGANWSSATGTAGYTIVSNEAAPSASPSAEEAIFWNAESFAADQYSEVTFVTGSNSAYIGPAVRCSSTSGGNYYGFYGDPNDRYLVRVVAGAWSQLATLGTGFTNGQLLRLVVQGDTLSAYVGTTPENLTLWTSVTDPNLTSGAPGLTSWANNNSGRLDNWTGLNLSASSMVPPPRRAQRVMITR
jgi:hypothetical protein